MPESCGPERDSPESLRTRRSQTGVPPLGVPSGAPRFIGFAFAILMGLKLARGILADKLRGGNASQNSMCAFAQKKSAARAADFQQGLKQFYADGTAGASGASGSSVAPPGDAAPSISPPFERGHST